MNLTDKQHDKEVFKVVKLMQKHCGGRHHSHSQSTQRSKRRRRTGIGTIGTVWSRYASCFWFAGAVKMLKATDAEQAAGDMLPEDGRLCPLSYGITENVCH